MSAAGARLRNGDGTPPVADACAERNNPEIRQSPAAPPYFLLWSTGVIALLLCLFAFAYWGVNGASTLFDLVAALCS